MLAKLSMVYMINAAPNLRTTTERLAKDNASRSEFERFWKSRHEAGEVPTLLGISRACPHSAAAASLYARQSVKLSETCAARIRTTSEAGLLETNAWPKSTNSMRSQPSGWPRWIEKTAYRDCFRR